MKNAPIDVGLPGQIDIASPQSNKIAIVQAGYRQAFKTSSSAPYKDFRANRQSVGAYNLRPHIVEIRPGDHGPTAGEACNGWIVLPACRLGVEPYGTLIGAAPRAVGDGPDIFRAETAAFAGEGDDVAAVLRGGDIGRPLIARAGIDGDFTSGRCARGVERLGIDIDRGPGRMALVFIGDNKTAGVERGDRGL